MSFLYFPKNISRIEDFFHNSRRQIIKSWRRLKKIALMFSKNIMRYSNVDFKKGLKMVVMVVSSMLTIYISVNSYDNQPYFPLSLVVILSFLWQPMTTNFTLGCHRNFLLINEFYIYWQPWQRFFNLNNFH